MAGQLDVIGHDGDKIGVAGAQVSILQVTYCIIFPGEAHHFVTTVHIPTGKLRKRGRETAQLREDAAHFRETAPKWEDAHGKPISLYRSTRTFSPQQCALPLGSTQMGYMVAGKAHNCGKDAHISGKAHSEVSGKAHRYLHWHENVVKREKR